MTPNQSWQDVVQARQKQLEPLVERAIHRVGEAVAGRTPKITSSFFYGAIGIDPKHLVIWYIFATEAQKRQAEPNGLLEELDRKSREALGEDAYPPTVLGSVHVSFTSDEEIKRAGGWREFFA